MGLRKSVFEKAVASAFKALGDIPQAATYRRTVSLYNPNNGTMVKTNTDYAINVVVTGYSQFEIDRVNILATDQRGLVQVKDLAVVPSPTTDTLIVAGKTFSIIRAVKDPAQVLYTLHLRSPS